MNKGWGLILLLRPINCLMMGLTVLIGAAITYKVLYFIPLSLGFITGFTLTGASMVTNDYWDRTVDAVNTPNRPIASGLISTQLALLYAFILISIGFLSASLISTTSLLLASITLCVSLLYSFYGKKLGLIGNLLVSICIAMPLLFGGFLYEGFNLNIEKLKPLLLLDLLVFLANTGREVNKGIADIEGDKLRGIKTIALRFGSKNAAIIAVIFYLSAVVLSLVPWLLSLTTWIYLPLVAVVDVGFIVSSFILLSNYSKESVMKVKKMVLIWMGIGLLTFAVGVP